MNSFQGFVERFVPLPSTRNPLHTPDYFSYTLNHASVSKIIMFFVNCSWVRLNSAKYTLCPTFLSDVWIFGSRHDFFPRKCRRFNRRLDSCWRNKKCDNSAARRPYIRQKNYDEFSNEGHYASIILSYCNGCSVVTVSDS